MLYMIFIKGVVVRKAVCKLDVDGWKTGLHQLQIDQQAPSAAIAVDEGVDTLKLNVEPGDICSKRLVNSLIYR